MFVNFLRESKQAYYFSKNVEQSDLLVDLFFFWDMFFVFPQWYVEEFLFRWQLRYFRHKISLEFVIFSHFYTVFRVFPLSF